MKFEYIFYSYTSKTAVQDLDFERQWRHVSFVHQGAFLVF